LKFLSTLLVLVGYLKSTPENSISPLLITFSPLVSLVSIYDFSSIIAKIFLLELVASFTDGQLDIAIPVPRAATKIMYIDKYESY